MQLRHTLDTSIYLAKQLDKHITFKLSADSISEIRSWCEFQPCTNPSSPRVGYYKGVEIYYEV